MVDYQRAIAPHPIVANPTASSHARSYSATSIHSSTVCTSFWPAPNVTVGMPHMHLAHAPRHVGRRPCDFDSLLQAVAMDAVDIVDPDRHPHALVPRLIAARTEC